MHLSHIVVVSGLKKKSKAAQGLRGMLHSSAGLRSIPGTRVRGLARTCAYALWTYAHTIMRCKNFKVLFKKKMRKCNARGKM